ncbi:MAG: trypsin-like serine protease [Phycisphaeraceae bacterium]|nr:trypsin-like serine protease [Phycisphaeraceae bacterium]
MKTQRNVKIGLALAACLLIHPRIVWGIVTSSPPENWVVPPGDSILSGTLNLDGVVLIEIEGTDFLNNPVNLGWATGARLKDTNVILTAAHVLDEAKYGATIGGIVVDRIHVYFRFGAPNQSKITIESQSFGSRLDILPGYTRKSLPGGGGRGGYDIGLIDLPWAPISPGYDIDNQSPNAVLSGWPVYLVGKGNFGIGSAVYPADGQTRYSENRYESQDIPEVQNTHTMFGYDFDGPPAYGDTSYWDVHDTTGYGQQGMIAPADSGGPTFTPFGRIIGVHSFGGTVGTDVNYPTIDSSWGEIAADAAVSTPQINVWIRYFAFNSRGWQAAAGGTMMTTSNWYGDALPSGSENADVVIGGTYTLSGPSTGQTFSAAGLTIGDSDGVKDIQHVNGGNITISGDITIDTNGGIYFAYGNITADQLIVKGESIPAGPLYYGLFVWSDYYELGSSSLTVNSIEVGPGGDFVHDWLNPATGTLSAGEMNIANGGRAFFQWDASGIQHVNNDGLLSMGEYVEGNSLAVNTFTQTEYGQTLLLVGPSGGTGDMIADSIAATGAVSLDGQLVFILADGYTPSLYESFTLMTGSPSPAFSAR